MRTKHSVLAAFFAALAVGYCPAQEGKPAPVPSTNAASQARADNSLPVVFISVLPEIKTKSHLPILLPSELPKPIRKAKHALIEKVPENEYAISLYFELGIGDAGFAAYFSGAANPGYSPQELGNVSEVKLAHGLRGFFRPISCGGSCAPANLWWETNGIVYQIQLELPYSLTEEDQQKKTMTEVANSAILAGPR
jgi:hypothetical protein